MVEPGNEPCVTVLYRVQRLKQKKSKVLDILIKSTKFYCITDVIFVPLKKKKLSYFLKKIFFESH